MTSKTLTRRLSTGPFCSMALSMGLCVAAVAPSPADARASADDCGMQLRRICCRSQDVILYMGCAPQQKIPLDLGPGRFEIFVDGERVEGSPAELALRADKAHVVFVKREGHVPEMVVLHTERQGGRSLLTPAEVRVRLRRRPARAGRAEVKIELE